MHFGFSASIVATRFVEEESLTNISNRLIKPTCCLDIWKYYLRLAPTYVSGAMPAFESQRSHPPVHTVLRILCG